jgi:Subtilase family
MPDLPHLPLRRVQYEAPRKKRPGFGSVPQRDYQRHGGNLQEQLEGALQEFNRRPPPQGINPELILRVKLVGNVDEESWNRSGLILVGQAEEKTLILFSTDTELRAFRERLSAYQSGPQEARRNAPYAPIFANIEEVGKVQPVDRIGRLFLAEGLAHPDNFSDGTVYTVDVELWHTGNQQECRRQVEGIREFVVAKGGRVTDDYVGSSLVLIRLKTLGRVIKTLLEVDAISTIDRPPRASLKVSQQLDISLQDLQQVPAPPNNAGGICILDSGITSGHPLLAPAIGEATAVPAQLGTPADDHGHGTMVAGLALYGDVQECIQRRQFVPQLRLYSARVLNQDNRFDDDALITTQMRQAIEYFKNTYNCKVFNASLGDDRLPFNSGKVSAWASILDHLSRELNVLIVVSAGNYEHEPPQEGGGDHHVQGYPGYLLDPPARIIEPATGCIILTVGALANSADLPVGASASVANRPIAQPGQPSPFTRSGPGIGGAIKPELCEYGGNLVYDGYTHRTRKLSEAAIVSLNRDYLQRLFRTDSGTSYAAPRVAHIAARVWFGFPQGQANLIRALLAASATVPEEAHQILKPISKNAVRQLCGYGVPSHDRALHSDANRVILYAQGELPFDMFHIYEVPIPDEIYNVDGQRQISVTLAFDPPVRHSRLDYLGTTMSFRLIRGKSLGEVESAFRQRNQGAQQVAGIGSPYDCPMDVKPTEREGGTLQKASFTMKRTPENYGDTYFLVVRCQREWALDEHAPQRYATVVTVEHQAQVNLYARIQSRLQIPVRQRTRSA